MDTCSARGVVSMGWGGVGLRYCHTLPQPSLWGHDIAPAELSLDKHGSHGFLNVSVSFCLNVSFLFSSFAGKSNTSVNIQVSVLLINIYIPPYMYPSGCLARPLVSWYRELFNLLRSCHRMTELFQEFTFLISHLSSLTGFFRTLYDYSSLKLYKYIKLKSLFVIFKCILWKYNCTYIKNTIFIIIVRQSVSLLRLTLCTLERLD